MPAFGGRWRQVGQPAPEYPAPRPRAPAFHSLGLGIGVTESRLSGLPGRPAGIPELRTEPGRPHSPQNSHSVSVERLRQNHLGGLKGSKPRRALAPVDSAPGGRGRERACRGAHRWPLECSGLRKPEWRLLPAGEGPGPSLHGEVWAPGQGSYTAQPTAAGPRGRTS
jgi:hypothetical protein